MGKLADGQTGMQAGGAHGRRVGQERLSGGLQCCAAWDELKDEAIEGMEWLRTS
jgi:hypothetical protein